MTARPTYNPPTTRGTDASPKILALASFAMPLGAGQLVDRLMAAQRFLALAYLAGTTILVSLAWGVPATTPWTPWSPAAPERR